MIFSRDWWRSRRRILTILQFYRRYNTIAIVYDGFFYMRGSRSLYDWSMPIFCKKKNPNIIEVRQSSSRAPVLLQGRKRTTLITIYSYCFKSVNCYWPKIIGIGNDWSCYWYYWYWTKYFLFFYRVFFAYSLRGEVIVVAISLRFSLRKKQYPTIQTRILVDAWVFTLYNFS